MSVHNAKRHKPNMHDDNIHNNDTNIIIILLYRAHSTYKYVAKIVKRHPAKTKCDAMRVHTTYTT